MCRIAMTNSKRPTRPRDANQLAHLVAAIATGDQSEAPILTDDGRDLAAVLLGRRGGLKGGRARADSLTALERQAIARKAAKARWGNAK